MLCCAAWAIVVGRGCLFPSSSSIDNDDNKRLVFFVFPDVSFTTILFVLFLPSGYPRSLVKEGFTAAKKASFSCLCAVCPVRSLTHSF